MYESRKILNDAGVTQGQGEDTRGGWGLKGKEGERERTTLKELA